MSVLEGFRVLDFGRYVAGPYCATLLADLGAEVIRIERREGSEDRYIQPVKEATPGSPGGEGALFLQMNRNKLGMTLDPMTERGREVVRRLAATADVVVANLPSKTLQAMGLDYDTLVAVKPDIILACISAFGNGGPYSERVGFDGVAQAMCGSAYLSGSPDAPMKSYAAWVDFGTASLAAFGTVAALMERMRTGKGQIVEGALFSTALAFFNFHLIEQELRHTNRVAIGNRSPYAGPVDMVPTQDGWIVVQVLGAPLFKRWARLVADETRTADDWINDPRFKDDISRGNNGEALSERTAQWAATRTTAEALTELETARIPAGPVYSPEAVLADPHVRAMNYMKPVSFPGVEKPAPIMETPVRLSETPATIRHRAPLLGEHTDQILTELGYSTGDIASLREDGII